jgi:hypothetical protein
MDETAEQTQNSRPWLYKKGQSGNPSGRPKGSFSLKTYVKNKIATMTVEEREEYLEGLPKQFIWEMAEGKADTKTTVDATIEHKVAPETLEQVAKALEEFI